jgi:Putative peptidoglycan binding domain
MYNENNLGVILDNRSQEEKNKDFRFEEIVANATPVQWREKPESEWRKFPDQDQNGSGSCVAQTMKKIMGVYIWLKTGAYVALSATHIFQRRVNRPASGMGGDDVFKIAQKGVTLEVFAPSELLTDEKMDKTVVNEFASKVGEIFKIGAYLQVNSKDIETVASIIQETGKAVMVWFFFKGSEWSPLMPVVEIPDMTPGGAPARHSVAAVDFTLYKGKRSLVIEDSAHFGKRTRRVVTEDFFKKRNFFVAHFMNFAFENAEAPTLPKPRYTFNHDMEFSETLVYDADVVKLQDILKYEGMFPSNTDSTGYFGAITKRGVEQYQEKYNLGVVGRVGPKTRAHLNKKYS